MARTNSGGSPFIPPTALKTAPWQWAVMLVIGAASGAALAMEHNGDVYSCDHYVYPRYRLGNLMNASLGELVNSAEQKKFGSDKLDTLPRYCRQCEVRFACNGECPKHRFITTPDGEPGLNYLCPAYKRFFNHIDPYMRTIEMSMASARSGAASRSRTWATAPGVTAPSSSMQRNPAGAMSSA